MLSAILAAAMVLIAFMGYHKGTCSKRALITIVSVVAVLLLKGWFCAIGLVIIFKIVNSIMERQRRSPEQ